MTDRTGGARCRGPPRQARHTRLSRCIRVSCGGCRQPCSAAAMADHDQARRHHADGGVLLTPLPRQRSADTRCRRMSDSHTETDDPRSGVPAPPLITGVSGEVASVMKLLQMPVPVGSARTSDWIQRRSQASDSRGVSHPRPKFANRKTDLLIHFAFSLLSASPGTTGTT
jgi:hypothetical protein